MQPIDTAVTPSTSSGVDASVGTDGSGMLEDTM